MKELLIQLIGLLRATNTNSISCIDNPHQIDAEGNATLVAPFAWPTQTILIGSTFTERLEKAIKCGTIGFSALSTMWAKRYNLFKIA
jgi:hypothetical protein